ncbi:MAG TPA: hypothetical protein ENG35_06105 [Desulfobacteraceae bacterium]|nr:hypothetical protein [Desulfobacteraceae bacterium]
MSKLKKALEKATEAKSLGKALSTSQTRKIHPVSISELKKNPRDKNEISITYTQTQVHPLDPNKLKKNRVFTLFKDHKITDQIDLLRTQILNRLKENGGNSILVTSAHPGEGKTFTSINLGISIAQELDRTVLLVDADLRRPAKNHFDFMKDFFGINTDKGLADYLLKQAEFQNLLINPGMDKLTILPSGRYLPNSAELLGSARMEKLANEMKMRYRQNRIVIFDSSSLLIYPDPIVLSILVDGILLVVETEKSTQRDIERMIELLKGRPILGTLLNKDRSKRD